MDFKTFKKLTDPLVEAAYELSLTEDGYKRVEVTFQEQANQDFIELQIDIAYDGSTWTDDDVQTMYEDICVQDLEKVVPTFEILDEDDNGYKHLWVAINVAE